MSTAATTYGRQRERSSRSVAFAIRLLQGLGGFLRALAHEVGRIPTYQSEAERIRQELLRGQVLRRD